jgi:Uri superfamily endonuclease
LPLPVERLPVTEASPGGTYTLLVELAGDATLEVGALGEYRLHAGWYAYTGSALGTGGFARVDRHRELARGGREVRHWHVDYLLGHPDATIRDVVRTPGADIECPVARELPRGPIAGFGASDCDCRGHLARFGDADAARTTVREAHTMARSGAD